MLLGEFDNIFLKIDIIQHGIVMFSEKINFKTDLKAV